jgi:hypothetical protein
MVAGAAVTTADDSTDEAVSEGTTTALSLDIGAADDSARDTVDPEDVVKLVSDAGKELDSTIGEALADSVANAAAAPASVVDATISVEVGASVDCDVFCSAATSETVDSMADEVGGAALADGSTLADELGSALVRKPRFGSSEVLGDADKVGAVDSAALEESSAADDEAKGVGEEMAAAGDDGGTSDVEALSADATDDGEDSGVEEVDSVSDGVEMPPSDVKADDGPATGGVEVDDTLEESPKTWVTSRRMPRQSVRPIKAQIPRPNAPSASTSTARNCRPFHFLLRPCALATMPFPCVSLMARPI